MILKPFWDEISVKWPRAYWDDWIRLPEQRQDRDCIHPEISRTYTFGEHGSSQGQFFGQFLRSIKLNTAVVDWENVDISYLEKDNWDPFFDRMISVASRNVIVNRGDLSNLKDSYAIMYYDSQIDFKNKAALFNLMDDFKSGVPRTGYRGVVRFRYESNIVLLAPK